MHRNGLTIFFFSLVLVTGLKKCLCYRRVGYKLSTVCSSFANRQACLVFPRDVGLRQKLKFPEQKSESLFAMYFFLLSVEN